MYFDDGSGGVYLAGDSGLVIIPGVYRRASRLQALSFFTGWRTKTHTVFGGRRRPG